MRRLKKAVKKQITVDFPHEKAEKVLENWLWTFHIRRLKKVLKNDLWTFHIRRLKQVLKSWLRTFHVDFSHEKAEKSS